MDGESAPRPRKGGRGISWSYNETVDLLAIWGEEKVQEQLRGSHRNIDLFEKIAEEMKKKGHDRTAEECRTKTKLMRKNYRQVTDHNSKSGNNAATMPFYKELHAILGGDANYHPKRLGSTTDIVRVPRGSAVPHHAPIISEEEGFPPSSQEMLQGFSEELFSQSLEISPTQNSEDATVTLTLTEEGEENGVVNETQENTTVVVEEIDTVWSTTPARNAADLSNPTATLSPAERLALFRRKKRSSDVEQMMANTRSVADLFASRIEKVSKEQTQSLHGYLQKFYEHSVDESERMLKEIQRQNDLFGELVSHIRSIGSVKKRVVERRNNTTNNVSDAEKENYVVEKGDTPTNKKIPSTLNALRPTRVIKKKIPLSL